MNRAQVKDSPGNYKNGYSRLSIVKLIIMGR